MHQVEGDLGGGVNISANLVRARPFALMRKTNCSVGNFETGVSMSG